MLLCLLLTWNLLCSIVAARFNLVVTIIHVILVLFIIIAGFVKSNRANLQPFAPQGARGVFTGAAVVSEV